MQVPRSVEDALAHLAQRQVPSGVDLRGGEVRDRRVVVAVVVPVEGLGVRAAPRAREGQRAVTETAVPSGAKKRTATGGCRCLMWRAPRSQSANVRRAIDSSKSIESEHPKASRSPSFHDAYLRSSGSAAIRVDAHARLSAQAAHPTRTVAGSRMLGDAPRGHDRAERLPRSPAVRTSGPRLAEDWQPTGHIAAIGAVTRSL